ncbi:MAG: carboxypeptidase regulatory-like domain-containing protein [Planctomycetes bacterium]|nr:carboxypeptidase regulatory-like domain-containing protein [Planctomycetota bacterium]
MLATLLFVFSNLQTIDAAPQGADLSSWISSPGSEGDTCTSVRFLDAETARPLAGVTVELWTEEGSKPTRAATRLMALTSGEDGGLLIPPGLPYVRADKLRISRPGYASREVHGALDAGEFLLQPALARAFRVLDLDGRPVAGATLVLRESCAHAVPASSATTDWDGRAVLVDLPYGHGEVEVFAGGFGALSQRWLDHSLLDERAARFAEPIELRVARRAGFELELIDAHGAPLVGRRIVHMDGPLVPAWSDESGRLRHDPLCTERAPRFELSDAAGTGVLDAFELPTGGVTRVALADGPPPIERHFAELAVRFEGLAADGARPPVVVRGSDGRARSLRAGENAVATPLGPTRVKVGAAFSGWSETTFELDSPVDAALTIRPEREAALVVALPENTLFVHAQAGDDSITREEPNESRLSLYVPTDRRVVLWAETAEGAAYRAELAPLRAGAQIDVALRENCVRAVPSTDARPRCRVRFEVRSLGTRLGAGEVRARLAHALGDESIEHAGPDAAGGFEFELPRGDLYRVRFDCELRNCVPVELVGRVPDAAESTRPVELVARARVTFEHARIVFGPGASPADSRFTDGARELAGLDLAPGLTTLQVQTADGKTRVVRLDLKPGEVRELEEP